MDVYSVRNAYLSYFTISQTRADKKGVRRKLTVKCIETKYLAVLSKQEMDQTAIARQFKLSANTLDFWPNLNCYKR
jgi:hypothetical protein